MPECLLVGGRASCVWTNTTLFGDARRWQGMQRALLSFQPERVEKLLSAVAKMVTQTQVKSGMWSTKTVCHFSAAAAEDLATKIVKGEIESRATTPVLLPDGPRPTSYPRDRMHSVDFVLLRHATAVYSLLTAKTMFQPQELDNTRQEDFARIVMSDEGTCVQRPELKPLRLQGSRAKGGGGIQSYRLLLGPNDKEVDGFVTMVNELVFEGELAVPLIALVRACALPACSTSGMCDIQQKRRIQFALEARLKFWEKRVAERLRALDMCSADQRMHIIEEFFCRVLNTTVHQAEEVLHESWAGVWNKVWFEEPLRVNHVVLTELLETHVLAMARLMGQARDVVLQWVDWTLHTSNALTEAYHSLADGVFAKAEGMAGVVQGLRQRLDEQDQRVAQLTQQLEGSNSRADAAEAQVLDQRARFTAKVQQLNADGRKVMSTNSTLKEQLAAANADVARLQTALDGAKAELRGLTGQLQKAHGENEANKAALATLQATVQKKGGELGDLIDDHRRLTESHAVLSGEHRQMLDVLERNQEWRTAVVKVSREIGDATAGVKERHERLVQDLAAVAEQLAVRAAEAEAANKVMRAQIVKFAAMDWVLPDATAAGSTGKVSLKQWPFEDRQTHMTPKQSQWIKELKKVYSAKESELNEIFSRYFFRQSAAGTVKKSLPDLKTELQTYLGLTFLEVNLDEWPFSDAAVGQVLTHAQKNWLMVLKDTLALPKEVADAQAVQDAAINVVGPKWTLTMAPQGFKEALQTACNRTFAVPKGTTGRVMVVGLGKKGPLDVKQMFESRESDYTIARELLNYLIDKLRLPGSRLPRGPDAFTASPAPHIPSRLFHLLQLWCTAPDADAMCEAPGVAVESFLKDTLDLIVEAQLNKDLPELSFAGGLSRDEFNARAADRVQERKKRKPELKKEVLRAAYGSEDTKPVVCMLTQIGGLVAHLNDVVQLFVLRPDRGKSGGAKPATSLVAAYVDLVLALYDKLLPMPGGLTAGAGAGAGTGAGAGPVTVVVLKAWLADMARWSYETLNAPVALVAKQPRLDPACLQVDLTKDTVLLQALPAHIRAAFAIYKEATSSNAVGDGDPFAGSDQEKKVIATQAAPVYTEILGRASTMPKLPLLINVLRKFIAEHDTPTPWRSLPDWYDPTMVVTAKPKAGGDSRGDVPQELQKVLEGTVKTITNNEIALAFRTALFAAFQDTVVATADAADRKEAEEQLAELKSLLDGSKEYLQVERARLREEMTKQIELKARDMPADRRKEFMESALQPTDKAVIAAQVARRKESEIKMQEVQLEKRISDFERRRATRLATALQAIP